MNQPVYFTDRQLAARFGVSRQTIWRWSGTGRMPQPVKLSPGFTRWRIDAIEAWEQEKAAEAG